MIHAYLKSQSGKDSIRTNEDALTASVITTLLHLPVELVWEVFRSACTRSSELPKTSGRLLGYDFWPHWVSKHTKNSNHIEPDVFLRFEHFDVIIEAKRWDERQQSKYQWQREYTAYLNEYEEEQRQVFMFAIGGLHSDKTGSVTPHHYENDPIKVYKFRWRYILREVQKLHEDLKRVRMPSSQTQSHIYTLQSIIDSMAWFGFVIIKWFKDFEETARLRIDDTSIAQWRTEAFPSFHYSFTLPSAEISYNPTIFKQWQI